ncbi:MAG TPA: phosphatidylinositol-specific phospholipase C1-like protein [Acidimicrobiales bacterium]|nr:phosphatidylinositol-specific phospholipase C1-like protein [Acidimicrobiales bacterium]
MVRRRRRPSLLLAAALTALLAGACRPIPVGGAGGDGHGNGNGPKVTINQIQVLASHNSYHVEPEPALLAALRSALGAAADGFEYTHRPLADELDAGVREVELDVFVDDPAGGRYAHPKLLPLLGLDPVDPALAGPGLKVLHVQEVDYRSTCPTFVACLQDIRDWSGAHRGHLPITIQIEAKDDVIPDPVGLGFVQPPPWTAPGFADLEAEIRSVFGDDQIITPGDVKGRSSTLAEAVGKGRWPTLNEARDQVMFVLDDKGAKRDAYRSQVPDVDDRLIFVDVPPTDPDAGVMVVNDPIGDAARIRDLVAQGFIVRTRADADTVEARSGDTTRRDAAFASGAQYVSTDYVFPDDHFGTGYVADLPGSGAARCNPVNAPKRCERADLSG